MKIVLLISGLLGFLANIPYALAILRTRSSDEPMRPSRVSWFTWAVLDILIVASSIANGATLVEIALPLGYLFGAVCIAILSIFYGEWGPLSEALAIMVGSAVGIFLWLFSGPQIALFAFVAVLFMSAWPSIKKIYLNPKGEDKFSWTVWAVAASLSVVALGNPFEWTIQKSLVSLSYFVLYIPIIYSFYFKN